MTRPELAMKHADARRRIHVAPDGRWSFGPTGTRFRAESPAAAVEEALDRIGHEPAVIIYEGRPG